MYWTWSSFFFKRRFRQYGLWERYADLYPDEDLVYTIGVSDYKKDWFFAQVTRYCSSYRCFVQVSCLIFNYSTFFPNVKIERFLHRLWVIMCFVWYTLLYRSFGLFNKKIWWVSVFVQPLRLSSFNLISNEPFNQVWFWKSSKVHMSLQCQILWALKPLSFRCTCLSKPISNNL